MGASPSLARSRTVAAAVALAGALVWGARRPSSRRDWAPEQAVMPRVAFDGPLARVSGIRDAEHLSAEACRPRWRERTVDLREARSVDFFLEPLGRWHGLAHAFLSFGFADGSRLGVSVEVRRERGERYSPLRGLLRRYELMYVLAEERDLVGLRTHFRGHALYRYPVRASPERVAALLRSVLARAQALSERPEFYNTLTNSCATNIARHVRELAPGRLPRSAAVLLPGYSDRLAYDLGLLEAGTPFEELRRAGRADERARACPLDERFSVCLRS